MTKEGIKAVRFCMGYNTNLRVKLTKKVIPGTTPYQESVKNFLESNFYGIFGLSVLDRLGLNTADPVSLGMEKYGVLTSFLYEEAWDVCTGEPRDNLPPLK